MVSRSLRRVRAALQPSKCSHETDSKSTPLEEDKLPKLNAYSTLPLSCDLTLLLALAH